MSRFSITELPLPGLKLIERHRLGDPRGFLTRVFCSDELSAAGWAKPVAQINHTYTARRGTVRGMHFQYSPNVEMKLVTCIRGEVWDVAVDVRRESPTFLAWHAEVLSADNCRALLIPEGVAHGFQALTDDVELIYCHSAPHRSETEGGLHPEDPQIAIAWPLPVAGLSPRDTRHPFIRTGFEGMRL